jgi:multimeric flavodoxin WrbA
MKILVINGSPKGEKSITLQHMKYIEKHQTDVYFEYVNMGQQYKKINDDVYFESVIDKMLFSDLVIFAYPVYVFSIPYQLMVFMDRLQNDRPKGLDRLYVTQFSTSKHFFNLTAHDYMTDVFSDLGMKELDGYTADMNEMLEEEGQTAIKDYFSRLVEKVELKYITNKKEFVVKDLYDFEYHPIAEEHKIPSSILIIYNGKDYSDTLKNMITALANLLPYQVHLLDLANYNISGGCIGCLNCAFTTHCIYPDDFEKMHREKIANADVIIYASDIKNHWFHTSFKALDDRSFYNGHRITMEGRGVTYLLQGCLSSEHNLEKVMKSRASVTHMHYIQAVTNETEDILDRIRQMCDDITYFMENRPRHQDNYDSVGGMKILRDLVYDFRSIMFLDHDYYKKMNLYDFPKKNRIQHFFTKLAIKYYTNPKRFKKHANKVSNYALNAYKKILESED